jgi:tryptophan synthase beta chain
MWQVVPVTAGSQTLKDAINEGTRDWVSHARKAHTHPRTEDFT